MENEVLEMNEGTEVLDMGAEEIVESTGGSKVGIVIGVALAGAAAAGVVALVKKSGIKSKIEARRIAKLEKAGYEVYPPADMEDHIDEEDFDDSVEESDEE